MPVCGQVFQVGAGTSSLYRAHGGSLGFQSPGYDGWVGVGSLEGFKFGAFLRRRARGTTFSFGDDMIPFRLPTDIFDNSHYFPGRGVGVARVRERLSFFGFAGVTSVGFGTPFFRAARAEKSVGLFFLDSKVTPTLRAFSRTVFSDRQTSINGVEWQPRAGLRTAIAGGLGANEGYFASSLTAERDWVSVKGSYIAMGNRFRRIVLLTPLSSEIDRENILVTLRPKPFLTLSAGRHNYLQPVSQGRPAIRGTTNQYLASLTARRFTVSGALFDSHAQGSGSRGTSLSVGRDFAGRLQLNANFLRSRAAQGPPTITRLITLREVLSTRLSLLQLVTHSNGRTSVSFGGNFISNRASIGVEYQTLYVPFPAGNQFKQALVLNIRLQPFSDLRLNVGTFIAPDGTVKYTASGGRFFYREVSGGTGPAAMTLHKYVVRGRVTDERNNPLRGAALRVDGEVAFTDSQGEFFARKRKAGAYRLEVLVDQFLIPGRFEVVSAPPVVTAAPDATAPQITIIVRRSRPPAR